MEFVLAVSLLPSGSYLALALVWAGLVAVAIGAGLPPLLASRRAFVAAPFMLAALPLVVSRPEDPLGQLALGPLTLTISGEGLRLFATIALKSWVSVQAALLLSFTTPFHDLVDGLRELRLPRIMVAIISFMYRYLAVLTEEATRMLRARAARSADPTGRGGGSLRWRASVTGAMVGSLFLRSYERSERIYSAMQARGFDGEFRHLAGPAIGPAQLVTYGLLSAGLIAFELAAHAWIPRL